FRIVNSAMRSFLLFTALFFSAARVQAAGYFDFNARCMAAYTALLSLRIDEGIGLIEEERRANPENLIPVLLSNYGDCLPLLFNGEPAAYRHFKDRVNNRLEELERGDPESPWYLFCKATLNFQSAAVRIRFNDYL